MAIAGTAVVMGGDDEAEAFLDNPREAVAQCEGFADKRLKAPATASYDLTATESAGVWTVVGTVDSENGFGALVRSDVRCELHFANNLAHLDAISIN